MRIFKDTRGKSWFDILGENQGQVDITITYPEAIRAFHYHERKFEIFFIIEGEYKIVVHDTKTDKTTVTYLSQGDSIRIKPFTWHGYQVLGEKRGIILEYSSKKHDLNNPDDQREVWDKYDDWERERK